MLVQPHLFIPGPTNVPDVVRRAIYLFNAKVLQIFENRRDRNPCVAKDPCAADLAWNTFERWTF